MTKKPFKKGLCWLRRDLRLHDHAALHHCLSQCEETYFVFIFDQEILEPIKLKAKTDRRVQFICDALVDIQQLLETKGSGLNIAYGDPITEITKLVETLQIEALFFNRDYTPYATKRDSAVTEILKKSGKSVFDYQDCVVFEPHTLLNQSKKPFHVFTPYSKEWFKQLESLKPLTTFEIILSGLSPLTPNPTLHSTESVMAFAGFEMDTLLLKGGFVEAKKRLQTFLKKLPDYTVQRDFFNCDGTSKLSVYLRHGCISIRELVLASTNNPSSGSEKWLTELVWREFYFMIFYFYPEVNTQAFQTKFKSLPWQTNEDFLKAFKNGQTGFPIIDAAMRCLNQTGWMHNRLRMITASFCTKILLIDWKRGERYFSWKLLDYELQANNGGWQWSAGIGCDAAPYFRIFNPYTQSETYDPTGEFIRTYCPELSKLNSKDIHCPSKGKNLPPDFQLGRDYPHPIVDYSEQRKKCMAFFNS